jgi:protein TonB
MADLSWNPDDQFADDNLRKNFFGSLVLHITVAAAIAGLAYFHNPEKVKPPKVAEKPTPAPPKHPQPTPPQPNKAVTGETAGIRIPQSTLELKNGTASAMVQDRTFGSRFAYYVNIVNRTVAQNWFTQEADPRASVGKSVTVLFDIDRAGTPSNPRIETRSGSPSLDQSALRAVQRVEGFGPLPAGDHITVEYTFHYTQP